MFLAAEAVVLVGFGWLAFGVAVHGSLAALAVVCLLGALAFGGIALLVASRAKTIEGVSGLLNLVMLPMWVFSGVFFASSNFPDAIQPFVQALPLTALNDALRAVMNDGEPLRRAVARAGDPGRLGLVVRRRAEAVPLELTRPLEPGLGVGAGPGLGFSAERCRLQDRESAMSPEVGAASAADRPRAPGSRART